MIEDRISDEVRVITVPDGDSGRWITTIVGGAMDGWQAICREAYETQHAAAIEQARTADAARSA